jgi:hypothetical protein
VPPPPPPPPPPAAKVSYTVSNLLRATSDSCPTGWPRATGRPPQAQVRTAEGSAAGGVLGAVGFPCAW